MSRSEFRWNKKRKHYAYLFKDKGDFCINILITSKPHVIKHKNGKVRIILRNVKLIRHPNKNKSGVFYVIPKNYLDEFKSFDERIYNWSWDKNDKRKIKRIKKNKKVGYDSTNWSGQSPTFINLSFCS